MKNANYIKIHKSLLEVVLDVIVYKNEDMFYAYAPALDIAGYGYNQKEAKASLNIMLEEYFRFACEEHTLEEDLRQHGWKEAARRQEDFSSPSFMTLLRKNRQLQDVVSGDFTKMSEQFSYSAV